MDIYYLKGNVDLEIRDNLKDVEVNDDDKAIIFDIRIYGDYVERLVI